MTPDRDEGPLLEFLPEPVFVLRRHGLILRANAAARRLLGIDPCGRSLFDFVLSSREHFHRYLGRCSGTTSSIVGAVTLQAGNRAAPARVYGARLQGGTGEARLALRCLMERDDKFSFLARRVRDLNVQLRRRLHEKAVLEEALAENRNLLRELQHRVKNNVQMMISLIQMSARGKETLPAVQDVVEAAQRRLHAMASAQEAIYRSTGSARVAARPILEDLVEAIGEGAQPQARVHLRAIEAELTHDVAHALALITNELVTNALKHGLGQAGGLVEVSFERAGGELRLSVQDNGDGFDPDAASRSSGLRLVRSLCRQIGGAFDVEYAGGARFTVRFSDSR